MSQGKHSAKKIMDTEGIKSGESFKIATEGHKLNIKVIDKSNIINLLSRVYKKTFFSFKVGRSELKSQRGELTKIGLDVFEQLQLNLDLSTNASRKLISTVNKGCGERKGFLLCYWGILFLNIPYNTIHITTKKIIF